MEENNVKFETELFVQEKPDNRQENSKKSWFRMKFIRFPKSWSEVKKLGWKFIAGFILFYLVRDTILYIIIPYLIVKGVISF